MTRSRQWFTGLSTTLLTALVAIVGVVTGPTGCGSSGSTDTLPPITGIVVRAETLTAGHGCGTNASQVFKYLVVVYGANPADTNVPTKRYDEFLAASTYDCFADGQFVELPVSGGSAQYKLQVYVYNSAAYAAAGGDSGLKSLTATLEGLRARVPADGGAGGEADRAAIRAELAKLPGTNPTFSTTCDATQLPDVQSLAVCQPLSGGATGVGVVGSTPATVVLPTASFPSSDGGTVACEDQYTSVRYRIIASGIAGEPAESRCNVLASGGLQPFVITVSPAAAPASYAFELALLRSDGTVFATTTCRADTSPGLTSTAACKPVQ